MKDKKIKILLPILILLFLMVFCIIYYNANVIVYHHNNNKYAVSDADINSYLKNKYNDEEFGEIELERYNKSKTMVDCDGNNFDTFYYCKYNQDYIVHSYKYDMDFVVHHYVNVPNLIDFSRDDELTDNLSYVIDSLGFENIIENEFGKYSNRSFDFTYEQEIIYDFYVNKNIDSFELDRLKGLSTQLSDLNNKYQDPSNKEKYNIKTINTLILYRINYNDCRFLYHAFTKGIRMSNLKYSYSIEDLSNEEILNMLEK